MIPPPPPRQIDSWQAAEANAAAWMRHWGFVDAQVTAAGPDGGVDVRSAGAIAQVKFEAAQVGAPAVQRLVGARGLAHDLALFFFSGAGYARPAVEYADMMGIALFKFGLDGSMLTMNPSAEAVLDEARALAIQDFPLAEVQRWADATAERRTAQIASEASWWRRNGWLAFSVFCFVGVLVALSDVVGLSEPSSSGELGWGGVFGYLAMGVGSYYLWRHLSNRRAARAQALSTTPAPGPLPAAVRVLGGRLPGARAGASAEEKQSAVLDLLTMVPGLTGRQSQTIVEALQEESGGRTPA